MTTPSPEQTAELVKELRDFHLRLPDYNMDKPLLIQTVNALESQAQRIGELESERTAVANVGWRCLEIAAQISPELVKQEKFDGELVEAILTKFTALSLQVERMRGALERAREKLKRHTRNSAKECRLTDEEANEHATECVKFIDEALASTPASCAEEVVGACDWSNIDGGLFQTKCGLLIDEKVENFGFTFCGNCGKKINHLLKQLGKE